MINIKLIKKPGFVIPVLVLCAVLLTACGSKQQQPLSGDFDQGKVEAMGKAVIDLVNAQDNQALRDMGTEEIKEGLTDEAMLPVYKALAKAGAFKEISKIDVAGHKGDNGIEYAIVIAKAQYEKKSMLYTISLTKDMKLAGLFCK